MKFPARAAGGAFLLAVAHGQVNASADSESSGGTVEGETRQKKRSVFAKSTELTRKVTTIEAGGGLSKQQRKAEAANNDFMGEEEDYWDRFLQTTTSTTSLPPETCDVKVSVITLCLKALECNVITNSF